MSELLKNTLLGVVRHVVTYGAGFLSANGWITGEQEQGLIGSVLFLASLVWSSLSKKRAEEERK